MDREIKTWLFDIFNSIEEIEQFLPQGKRLFDDYKNDLKTKELLKGISKLLEKPLIESLTKIPNLRSRIPGKSLASEIGSFMVMMLFRISLSGAY
jgi:hypothetical protein